jgi:hypothetical protein
LLTIRDGLMVVRKKEGGMTRDEDDVPVYELSL